MNFDKFAPIDRSSWNHLKKYAQVITKTILLNSIVFHLSDMRLILKLIPIGFSSQLTSVNECRLHFLLVPFCSLNYLLSSIIYKVELNNDVIRIDASLKTIFWIIWNCLKTTNFLLHILYHCLASLIWE